MSIAAINLRSIGRASSELGLRHLDVVRIVQRHGIKPTATIDAVPYFDDQAVDAIRRALLSPEPADSPKEKR